MNASPLLCIGHRGAMGHAPENTLASFAKALELGAPCIELDVYFVDGHLMVFHDDRLERTTNGSGRLREQSFDYLRTLNAGNGEKIATLEEVFRLVDRRAGINVELADANTAQPVVELVTDFIHQGRPRDLTLVSSFNHRELAKVRDLDPQLRIGALIRTLPEDGAAFAEKLGAYSVHVSLEVINQRFVEDAHGRGLRVFVYTVNHPEDISRMAELGVDGLFSDYPDRVLALSSGANLPVGWG